MWIQPRELHSHNAARRLTLRMRPRECSFSLVSVASVFSSMLALIDLRDQSHSLVSTLRDLQSTHASGLSSTSSSLSLLTELRRLTTERADLLRSASELQVSQSKQIPYFAAKQREYERETKDIEVRRGRNSKRRCAAFASHCSVRSALSIAALRVMSCSNVCLVLAGMRVCPTPH